MKKILLLVAAAALICGCSNDGGKTETGKPFDYSMIQVSKLTVDYNLAGAGQILFAVYDKAPATGVEPVLRAFTDVDGKFSGPVRVASGVTQLWVCTDFLDSDNQVIVPLSNGEATMIAGRSANNAIDPGQMLPDETYTYYNGTLCFEDLWPNRGDYDINDVVIEYECIVYTDRQNKVTRTVDKFRPIYNGAQLQSGFAIQYGASPSALKSKIEITSTCPDQMRQANRYVPITWVTDANNCETGQPFINVMLYDDNRRMKLTSDVYEFTVKTAFRDEALPLLTELGIPPYNPYVMIVTPDEISDELIRRGRELHLASTTWYHDLHADFYPPTAKMNPLAYNKWFGRYNDKSDVANNVYYISNDNYPFALNIPIHGFQHLRGANEGKKISDIFPGYASWAKSHGEQNKYWYLHTY